MSEDNKVKIKKYEGHNFILWRMHIEYYLYQKKLHEPFVEKKPKKMKQEEWGCNVYSEYG